MLLTSCAPPQASGHLCRLAWAPSCRSSPTHHLSGLYSPRMGLLGAAVRWGRKPDSWREEGTKEDEGRKMRRTARDSCWAAQLSCTAAFTQPLELSGLAQWCQLTAVRAHNMALIAGVRRQRGTGNLLQKFPSTWHHDHIPYAIWPLRQKMAFHDCVEQGCLATSGPAQETHSGRRNYLTALLAIYHGCFWFCFYCQPPPAWQRASVSWTNSFKIQVCMLATSTHTLNWLLTIQFTAIEYWWFKSETVLGIYWIWLNLYLSKPIRPICYLMTGPMEYLLNPPSMNPLNPLTLIALDIHCCSHYIDLLGLNLTYLLFNFELALNWPGPMSMSYMSYVWT